MSTDTHRIAVKNLTKKYGDFTTTIKMLTTLVHPTASFQGILVLSISFFVGFRPELIALIPALGFMILIALISLVFISIGAWLFSKIKA